MRVKVTSVSHYQLIVVIVIVTDLHLVTYLLKIEHSGNTYR